MVYRDEMGLGKTVQMITTMAMNTSDPENDDEPKATLIVVPLALLAQVMTDIQMFICYIHSSSPIYLQFK